MPKKQRANARAAAKPTAPGTPKFFIGVRDIFRYTIMALTVVAPFVQGLYWPGDKLMFGFLCFGLAALWLLVRPPAAAKPEWSLTHVALALLVGLYALGLWRPASVNGALRGLVLWASLLAVYWLVSDLRLDERERRGYMAWIVSGGLAMAAFGLVVYAGVYDAPAHLVHGRISAAFQYPNATASLLMLCLLVALGLGFSEENMRRRMFWTAAGVVLVPAFLFTLSRGGYLALLAGCALLALVLWRKLFAFAAYTAAVAAAGVSAAALFVAAPRIVGLAATPLLAALCAVAEARLVRPRADRLGQAALVLGAVFVIGAAALVFGIVEAPGLLPDGAAEAFGRITRRSLLEDIRFVFIGDGLRALRGSPWLGFGGGAWNAVYLRYQSFLYGATRAHSDPLDIVLEVGLVGLALFLAFVGAKSAAAWRQRAEPATAVIGAAAGAVLVHSVGEALLAFPAMYLLLFGLLGSLPESGRRYTPRFDMRLAAVPLLTALMLLSGTLYLAELELSRAQAFTAQGNVTAAAESLTRTLRVNPWQAEARRELARISPPLLLSEAELRANLKALAVAEPFDPRATNMLGHLYARRDDHTTALYYHRQSLDRQPRNIQNYETLALAAASAAISYRARGQAGWQAYADAVFDTHARFLKERERMPAHLRHRGTIKFVFSPALALALGEAHALRGDFAEASHYLKEAKQSTDAALAARAGLTLARVYELTGRSEEAQALAAAYGQTPGYATYLDELRLALR